MFLFSLPCVGLLFGLIGLFVCFVWLVRVCFSGFVVVDLFLVVVLGLGDFWFELFGLCFWDCAFVVLCFMDCLDSFALGC